MEILEFDYEWVPYGDSDNGEFLMDPDVIFKYVSDQSIHPLFVKTGWLLEDGVLIEEEPSGIITFEDGIIYTISQMGRPVNDFPEYKLN